MKKSILKTAALLGSISVFLGAVGGHLLEDYIKSSSFYSPHRMEYLVDVFGMALEYQFYHVFFLLVLGLSFDICNQRWIKYAFYLCIIGIFLFSGSLYLLCLTNNSLFGSYVTPIGGLSLILGYVSF